MKAKTTDDSFCRQSPRSTCVYPGRLVHASFAIGVFFLS